MNRRFEKRVAYAGAFWEIISGLITIFGYSLWVRGQGAEVKGAPAINNAAVQIYADNLFMFSVTFGILFVTLGVINIIMIRKLKDGEVQYKIPIWFTICGIASYLLMDFIGAIALISSGVLSLARNKSIAVANSKN